MKKITIPIFLAFAAFFSSCTRKTCDPFDFSHRIMDFYYFHDIDSSYFFKSIEDEEIEIIRSSFSYDDDKNKVWCGVLGFGCACITDLSSVYVCEEKNIKLSCLVSYDQLGGFSTDIQYGINDTTETFLLDEENNTVITISNNPSIVLNHMDSIEIEGNVYKNIYELAPKYNTLENQIDTIWIKEGYGIIGFKQNKLLWLRK